MEDNEVQKDVKKPPANEKVAESKDGSFFYATLTASLSNLAAEGKEAGSYPQLPTTLPEWLSRFEAYGSALCKQLAVIENLRFQAIVEQEKNIKESSSCKLRVALRR